MMDMMLSVWQNSPGGSSSLDAPWLHVMSGELPSTWDIPVVCLASSSGCGEARWAVCFSFCSYNFRRLDLISVVPSGSQIPWYPNCSRVLHLWFPGMAFSVALACKSCEDFMLHHVPCNTHSVRVKVNSHVIDLTTLERRCTLLKIHRGPTRRVVRTFITLG